MKSNVKFEKLRRFWRVVLFLPFVPLRLLSGRIAIILAFRSKSYPPAFEEFGIRVVDYADDKTWKNHAEIYSALELLNRHDKEKLELVKKYIRRVFLGSIKQSSGFIYLGMGVCVFNLQKIPIETFAGQRAIRIAERLVYIALKRKFMGMFGAHLPMSDELAKHCREEIQRTGQKLSNEISRLRH